MPMDAVSYRRTENIICLDNTRRMMSINMKDFPVIPQRILWLGHLRGWHFHRYLRAYLVPTRSESG